MRQILRVAAAALGSGLILLAALAYRLGIDHNPDWGASRVLLALAGGCLALGALLSWRWVSLAARFEQVSRGLAGAQSWLAAKWQRQPAARLAGRLERRRPYGFGMGAACGLRLREGDRQALLMLAAWVALRLRVLGGGLLSARWGALREEALVLGGTAAGLAHGLREDRSGARA